jgi:hypothetical protein
MNSLPVSKRNLLIGLLLAALILLPVTLSAAPAAQECTPPECYEPPPPPPPPPPSNPNPPSGGSWSGYSDGRLNPDMAEYYSVWCANDHIEVWGGKPTPQLIILIPIVSVLQLGDVGSFDAGAGMTVSLTGDAITITGSNGNNAPNPGSKSFSLNECLARNGSTPEVPPDQPPAPVEQPVNPPPEDDPEETAASRRLEADEEVEFCFSSFEFFGDDIQILRDCLDFVLEEYRDVLTGTEIVSLILMLLCFNMTLGLGILPIGIVVFLRWHRRWLRKQDTLG